MKSNLAHEPPLPQGQVVHFPKNERKAMSNKEERYTKMPNTLIDSQIMAQLNDKAFKCLMFVMRQTIGFDRVSHPIAITQFQKYCGIKKRDTVMSCIRDLEELGLIKVERTTGCLSEYQFTPDQYREKGLVPNEGSTLKGDGTSTTKRDGTSTAKGDGTSTVERDPIKETLKETFKENFKEKNTQENSVDQVLKLWTPDLHSLNSWLQRSGETPMTQELVNQILLEVNAHYEPRLNAGQITDTQMYSNFVKWIKRKYTQKQNSHSAAPAQNNRNVNQNWGQVQQYAPATDDIDLEGLV
ncbi:phage replication protein O domain [Acinetobacter sp. CIP 101966]|uniref:replication protein n=1 Tax=Acinetobacter sp. CIP 101966 TaxID=1144662 RepID=UPI0002D00879|nr:replication protein [Acinetobacter sp. CIP 101966]ENX29004.1 phage replication protein O domain [Acinetobacter sp. CIP 101966]